MEFNALYEVAQCFRFKCCNIGVTQLSEKKREKLIISDARSDFMKRIVLLIIYLINVYIRVGIKVSAIYGVQNTLCDLYDVALTRCKKEHRYQLWQILETNSKQVHNSQLVILNSSKRARAHTISMRCSGCCLKVVMAFNMTDYIVQLPMDVGSEPWATFLMETAPRTWFIFASKQRGGQFPSLHHVASHTFTRVCHCLYTWL